MEISQYAHNIGQTPETHTKAEFSLKISFSLLVNVRYSKSKKLHNMKGRKKKQKKTEKKEKLKTPENIKETKYNLETRDLWHKE